MQKRHWDREAPQFFSIHSLDWERRSEIALLAGLEVRILSVERDGSGSTWMLRLPPGWTHHHDATDATLELFTLEGDVSLEGERAGVGGYFFIPQGVTSCELTSCAGAQVIAYWSPGLSLGVGAEVRISRVWQQEWETQVMETMTHGSIAKSLRLPEIDVAQGLEHGSPAGMLRLILLPPGYADPLEHYHNCWEGLVFLSGDLLMPPRGIIGPGTYLGNPAEFWHGPMTTQFGSLMLVQTDKPVTQPVRAYAGAQQLVNGYRDSYSWLEKPIHTKWDGLPDYRSLGDKVDWSDPAPIVGAAS